MTEEAKGQRRPTSEDIDAVLEKISEGKALRAACRELGLHASSTSAVLKSEAVGARYAHARADRVEVMAEEVLTVSRAAALGAEVNGKKVDAAGARVYIDTVKWLAGRMDPKGEPPKNVYVQYEDITPEQRRAKIAQYQARIGVVAVTDEPDAEPTDG
jgi:hypothetical protein